MDADDPFDPETVSEHETLAEVLVEQERKKLVEFLERRRQAYARVFKGAHPDDLTVVMDDLKRFCRGGQTPWHDSERVHCLITGRHEVYTRITNHVNMTIDELFDLYAKE